MTASSFVNEDNNFVHGSTPWHNRAPELAAWTAERLVVRRDRYGEYVAEELIGKEYTRRDGSTGEYGDIRTSYESLSDARLVRHFRAQSRTDLTGLLFADPNNLCKSGALDIDQHGIDTVRAEANLTAALAWYRRLVHLGFGPLLTNSNGAGGYHLRVLLAKSIDAARIYHFMRSLRADHRHYGLDKPPEAFPKQADVRKCSKGLGNWLRVPGRHHKRLYWSEVWDGFRWLEGMDAVDYILDLAGDDPDLIPELPAAEPEPQRDTTGRSHQFTGGNLATYIGNYMRRLPNLAEGEGRDDVAFNFASFLVRDLKRTDAIALAWLERWDENNKPPKGTDRLKEIIKNAHTYGQRSYGSGLSSGRTSK
jgi:hypothetical protein